MSNVEAREPDHGLEYHLGRIDTKLESIEASQVTHERNDAWRWSALFVVLLVVVGCIGFLFTLHAKVVP